MKQNEQFPCSIRRCICSYKMTILKNSPIQEQNIQVSIFTGKRKSPYPHRIRGSFHDFKLFSDGFVYFRLSATATATATVAPTMGLLPMPRKPYITLSNCISILALLSFFVQLILFCCTACGQNVDKNLSSIQFDMLIISYLYMKLQGPAELSISYLELYRLYFSSLL